MRTLLQSASAALLGASLLPAAASAQDSVVFNWSDKWNEIYHRMQDLDGDGDLLDAGEVTFHIDPASPNSAKPSCLRVVNENGLEVTYFLQPTLRTISRGVDLDADGVLSDAEISDFRDSAALDGTSGMRSMDIADDGAVWWTSGGSLSHALSGLMRVQDLNGDGDGADPGEQVLMVDGNGLHTYEHDGGTASFAGWQFYGLAADGDGVIAYAGGDESCVFRFEDIDGDGAVDGQGESILLLNASGEHPTLPQNPDFANGTLKSLQSAAGYPTWLNYMATTEVQGERVYYFGTSASPFSSSGTNVNGDGINFLIFRGIDMNGDGDVNDVNEVKLFFDGSHTDGNPDLLLLRGLDVTEDDVLYAVGMQPYPAFVPGPDGNTWIHRFEDLTQDGDAMDAGEAQPDIFNVQSIGPGPLFPDPPNHGNMMCDPSDFSVRAVSPWTNLGGGILGSYGVPTVTGEGSLEAGTLATIKLVNCTPSAPLYLWMSFSSTPTPLFGGVLYTVPIDLQVLLNANGIGELTLSTAWPVGIPAGTNAWLQFVIQDTTLVPKMAFSNALRLTTP